MLGAVLALWGCSSDTAVFDGTGGAGGQGGSSQGGSTVNTGGMASSTTTGPTRCEPGSTLSCYTGPAGTAGVGTCMAGESTCTMDGSGYGECEGQVLPAFDDCSTNADEDCDGAVLPCTGAHLWSRKIEGGVGYNLAVDASGNALVTGNAGTLDVGNGPMSGSGVYVAKYDPLGMPLFAGVYGAGTGPVPGNGVAADLNGNILLAGFFFGTSVDFGGGALTNANQNYTDMYVAKLDPSGAHLWSKRFGDFDDQQAYRVTADANGNVIVVGAVKGTVDFGGGPLMPIGGWDIAVAKLDPNGNHLWSKRYGDVADQWGLDAAVDTAGNVFVTGWFYGTVNFGGQQLSDLGGSDSFVVKLDPSGNHLWSKRLGGPQQQATWGIATDPSGNVTVAGMYDGVIDLGGGPLPSAGSYDVFVGKLDPSGNHLWSKSFGDAGGQQIAMGVAVDLGGSVTVAGYFQSSVDFGGDLLITAGSFDIFVAKLDAGGNHVWSQRFGDTVEQDCFDVGVTPSGDILVTGMFWGLLGFGGPPLTATNADGYLARFSP